MIFALAFALDSVESELTGAKAGHGNRVAYYSALMAEKAGIFGQELDEFLGCSVLHDNALTEYLREEFVDDETLESYKKQVAEDINKKGIEKTLLTANNGNKHISIGEKNIEFLPFETDVKNIVLYHHENADGTGPLGKTASETNLKSQILHLTDIFDIMSYHNGFCKENFENAKNLVNSLNGRFFSSESVRLFNEAISWEKIEMPIKNGIEAELKNHIPGTVKDYTDVQIKNISNLLARIVDYKSSFTSRHSVGVAKKAEKMAQFYGFDKDKTLRFYFAGALHDIGKMVVTNDILEKDGKLTSQEFSTIKTHAEATYRVLSKMEGLSDITEWASNHHEKLDGSGYPQGLDAKDLSKEDRIMACIDIYQALIEARPYKAGMSHERAMQILTDMAEKGTLDNKIVADLDEVFGKSA